MSSIKKILFNRVISRAEVAVEFLTQCLNKIHTGGTDPAFSRSIYILHSYNFELILKSRLILLSKKKTIKDIDNELRGHDLESLSKNKNLKDVGILKIKKYKTGFKRYSIETVYGKFKIQDFTDVRYDYHKSSLRKTDEYESKRIKAEIEMMKKIINRIKTLSS